MTHAETQGPNFDGSRALARESKFGLAVTFVLSTLALGAADALGGLDTSGLPAWAEGVALTAVSTAVGLLTAWGTKNRKRLLVSRATRGRETF